MNRIGDDLTADQVKGALTYLTDAVEVANARGLRATAVEIAADEVFGINDRAQLAEAERHFQSCRRAEAMAAGVSLVAPETVFFAYDTSLGRDVTGEPNVVFGPGVPVADAPTAIPEERLHLGIVAPLLLAGVGVQRDHDVGGRAHVDGVADLDKRVHMAVENLRRVVGRVLADDGRLVRDGRIGREAGDNYRK